MKNYQNAKELRNLTLGKATSYCSQYNPDLLQAVPRSLNRDSLNLTQNNLPFFGEDVWYGYELSWLNGKGKPQVAVAEFRFPCQSTNIVESKSFKLYLNSFNQTRFNNWQDVEQRLIADLSATANTQVAVTLAKVDHFTPLALNNTDALCIDDIDIEINQYQLQESLLENAALQTEPEVEEHLVSHLLKSNCLITNQPDWATIFINYTGKPINHKKLLQYLISFREHNEFHEQCVERIYTDIQKYCQVKELTVYARYTRRGGLDINPYRSSLPARAPDLRTIRQ